MKAGNSKLEVGTRVEVVHVDSDNPDESIGILGSIGEITHPFGDSPDSVVGLWVETRGNVPFGVKFPDSRAGLCRGDKVRVLDTNEVVTL